MEKKNPESQIIEIVEEALLKNVVGGEDACRQDTCDVGGIDTCSKDWCELKEHCIGEGEEK